MGKEENRKEWTPLHTAVTVGLTTIISMFLGSFLGSYLPPSLKNTSRTFQAPGIPEVTRTYEDGKKDQIYVKDPNMPGDHSIIFKKYLNGISDPNKRQEMKTNIEQLVNW